MKLENELESIRIRLETLSFVIDGNKSLPKHPLIVATAFNAMRSAMVALDVTLHRRHNERYPVKLAVLDLSPTQSLDPETRAEIDATP